MTVSGADTRAPSARRVYAIHGTVFPGAPGAAVSVQRLAPHGYAPIGTARLSPAGAFSLGLPGAGRYRVVYDGIDGPAVNVNAG